jgi:hypothetical protein
VTPYTGQSLIWRPKTSSAIDRNQVRASGALVLATGACEMDIFSTRIRELRGISLNVAIKGDMWRSENMIFRCMFAPKEISRNLLKISFHLPTLIIRKRGPI